MKFSLGSNRGLAILAPGSPRVLTIDCATRAPTGPVVAASGSLTFTGEYQFNWKTEKSWTGCRRFELKLVDGSLHIADFRFK